MARVMEGNLFLDSAQSVSDQPDINEELADILDLGRELLGFLLQFGVTSAKLDIIFQERTAAAENELLFRCGNLHGVADFNDNVIPIGQGRHSEDADYERAGADRSLFFRHPLSSVDTARHDRSIDSGAGAEAGRDGMAPESSRLAMGAVGNQGMRGARAGACIGRSNGVDTRSSARLYHDSAEC